MARISIVDSGSPALTYRHPLANSVPLLLPTTTGGLSRPSDADYGRIQFLPRRKYSSLAGSLDSCNHHRAKTTRLGALGRIVRSLRTFRSDLPRGRRLSCISNSA